MSKLPIFQDKVSPLSNLSQYLIREDGDQHISDKITFLKENLLLHGRVMAEVLEKYHATAHQLMYMRMISLYGVLTHVQKLFPFPEETAGLLKTFPKIGNFATDEHDNIRFHPLSIWKLQNIILHCFRSLSNAIKIHPDEHLQKLLAEELTKIENDCMEICGELEKVPDIICKDISAGIKKDPKSPRVSILTTSMNLGNLVDETMLSVANQTYPKIEHIVIDGVSTDGSLEIIKKYPDVVLISEKDTGYTDALWKGIRIAKGEYILQCCISDSYAITDWIEKCVKILDENPDISLVSGLVCGLNKKSQMTESGFIQFHYNEAPQMEKMFDYWIRTGIHQPEYNLCVRKSVLLECFPSVEDYNNNHILEWVEFAYRFNRRGFMSYHIPVLANFNHADHDNKRGIELSKNGEYKRMLDNYRNKLNRYRWKLILGITKHQFIAPDGKKLDIVFDRKALIKDHLLVVLKQNKKFIEPKRYLNFFKKILPKKSTTKN